MGGVAVSAPDDDFNITIECVRKDGTMWFRTLIDGVETHDEDTTRALLRRVMYGLIQFSARLSNEDVDAILSDDGDDEGEAP
jgi:hypothetical protein